MVSPVPGYAQGTQFGARGSWWSCDRNAAGEGIHTGVDYPAPTGTKVVAARPGTVVYTDHGPAFGNHQLEVECGDGTRDFYAHMTARTAGNGSHVDAGDQVGKVGAEGNTSGPHLHFERHSVDSGPWSCAVITNPAPSIKWEGDDMPLSDDDLSKIAKRVNQVLGDYTADGSQRDPSNKDPDQGDKRLRQIENVVRDLQDRIKKIEKAVT
jgi:murein DD-endopeptidase MepM/ murein hydrolase activator NlpD